MVHAVAVASFGPLASVLHGDMPGGEVDDGGRNKERRNLARAAFQQAVCSRSMTSNPPMPEPIWTPTLFGVFRRDLQAGHAHGFIRRSHREVDEAAHLLNFFFLDEVQRVEVLDFGGDAGTRAVEASNWVMRADAALARQQLLPDLFSCVADCDRSGQCPVTTTRRTNYFPAFACLPM